MLPEYCGAVDCFPVVANDGASLAFLLVSMYSMYVCLHTPMSVYMEQPCLPAKYLLAVLLVTLHLSFLVVKYLGGHAVTPAEMFGTTTRCVAYLFYAAILTEHPYRDLPMLRAAFFAMAILGFWQCQQLLQEHPPDEAWKLGLHGGTIFLSGLALLPATLLQPSESPFDKANWFSRLTFAYVAPLMGVASFDPADIPALPVADATPTASRRFVSAYEMEKTTSPSLLRLLWRLHGRDIGGFFLWSIGNTVLNMMTPLLTKSLLEWSSRPAPSPSHGYLLASALVLQALLRTVSRSQYSLSKDRFNIRCTSGLQAGIYARVLSLGPRDGDCIGHVTNYVTMDVPVIVRLPGSLFDVALLPMQIAMALVVLGDEVSFAFLGGLVLLGAMLPLQVYLAHLVQRVKARLLAIRDDRLRLSVSTLVGIRTLKSFGWTRYFSDQLEHVRALELQALRLRQIITAFCDVLSSAAPLMIQTGVFVVIVYTGQPITAARAYTIISLLQQLVGPITDLPWIARSLGEAYVSFTRLSQFLFAPSALATDDDDALPSSFSWRNCTFGWTPETSTEELTAPLLCKGPFRLHLSELTLTPGANVVVCGRSGAGKSSLLLALLGDMPCVHGAAGQVADSIAYAPQTPWLVPGSLEYNVTLESDYEPNLYARVMALCRLDALPRTLRVSEEGANLSGGQRARVGLARALYQRAAVYLLDDCWSGLDTCTARAILADLRTVLPPSAALVLSTHALTLVRGLAPTLLVLDDGAIVERGAYDVLRATPGSRLEALIANDATHEPEVTGMPAPFTPLCERGGVDAVPEERRESGVVALEVWHTYAAAMGYRTAVAWPLTNVSLQLLQNGMDYWTAQYTTYHATSPDAFARGLIALTLGTLCMTTAHIGLVVHGSLRAAKTLYNRMTHQLLRTSLGFYETTPIGRILNRLGDDTSTVDTMIPMALDFLVLEVISITGSLVVLYFTNVYVLLLLLPLSAVYLYLQARYRPPARDLSRLNHVVQSPLMMHLKSTLNGLSVLRGRGSAAAWQTQFEAHLCLFQRVSLAQSLTLGWLAIRLDALGIVVAGFVGFSAAMAAARGHPMPSAYLGLTLMYALPIIRKLKLGLEAFVWAEQAMVSVERLREYGALPDEAGGREETTGDDVDWVTGGAIELMQVSLPRGRLTNVSVSIRALEKVGICGPSGAGKSSLLNCFFRAVDFSGRILIDGQDVAALSLQQLRAALAYVPQTTVLFATSVRKNLDPLDQYDDDRIWAALHACGLRSLVLGFPLQLEQFIDGSVLSQGQTQLLGIGRAVLKAAKIVCIDEATASVDHETDRRLRELMAKAFSAATVLTVAHRFAAIAASDRVLVLEHGRVVAFDSPTTLLQDAHGYFATMA